MDDAATVDHEVAIERRFDDPSHLPREVGRHRERRVGFQEHVLAVGLDDVEPAREEHRYEMSR